MHHVTHVDGGTALMWFRQVGAGAGECRLAPLLRGNHLHHGVVSVIASEVAVNTLNHAQRAVALQSWLRALDSSQPRAVRNDLTCV
jgi:hypothetical protein